MHDKTVQKLAIVTRCKENYADIAEITHPILKKYAAKCHADFSVISEDKYNLGSFFYEVFQCHEILEKYDRILLIDSDAIITPSCPNIFKIVPDDHIGVIYEDKYNRKKNRRGIIKNVQQVWGDIGWKKGYINMGVFVFSKLHKKLFDAKRHKLWMGLGYADISFGYHIHKYGYPIYELPYKFNHMSMFSEVGKNRLKSYVIHYAGRGFTGKKTRAEQIISDLKILQQNKKPFRLNIYNIPERAKLLAIGCLNCLQDK